MRNNNKNRNRKRRGSSQKQKGKDSAKREELRDRDLIQPWKGKPFRWSGKRVEVVQESRPEVSITCASCGEPIKQPSEAFIVDKGVVHFDCVLNTVTFGVELKENQKICYIGRGEFGLCEFTNPKHTGRFTILQRFALETLEERRELLTTLGGDTDWGIPLEEIDTPYGGDFS